MADYKELLRRAVEALPENNGAARRAVYEKARAALVGQLRAINPPLPARDITTHRLQLEDCIRQVEQEASEAVIAGMNSPADTPPPPVYFEPPETNRLEAPKPRPQPGKAPAGKAVAAKTGQQAKAPPRALPVGGTIEDIIAAANAEHPVAAKGKGAEGNGHDVADEPDVETDEDVAEVIPPKPASRGGARQLPSIVARAEAAKHRTNSTAFGVPPSSKPYDSPRPGPSIEPRQPGIAARGGQQAAVARQQFVEPVALLEQSSVAAAMSAVREVELEEPQPVDPQGAIDRAIATLDREARGEEDHASMNGEAANDVEADLDDEEEVPNGKAKGFGISLPGAKSKAAPRMPQFKGRPAKPAARESRMPALGAARNNDTPAAAAAFPRARAEREGMSAITIFLIVFAVLLAGAGGAGYWAVNQGYLDVSGMFSPADPAVTAEAVPAQPAAVTAEPAEPATGPGNTAAPAAAPEAATELATVDDRLTPEPSLSGEPLALAATTPAPTEERLSATTPDSAANAEAAVAALDPANVAGSQSLLLEASDSGTTGAVPFSGTVEWSKGVDETGLPTLVGKANIPARNLGVDVLIRKNSDASLPASHLMEINFRVSDTFIGGSIAGLPGVLLKNEELVQGTPLVGASARVVGNSFLFALSASPEDLANNNSLLTSRKWMDLALIYATGKRAIITLEKDSAAESLFTEVFGAWSQTASAQ